MNKICENECKSMGNGAGDLMDQRLINSLASPLVK